MSELLTPAEGAAFLKVSRRKFYDLITSKAFHVVRIGHGSKPPLRVRRSDLEAYVDQGGSVAAADGADDVGAARESKGPASKPRRTRRAAKTGRASVKARVEVQS
jgi:excisionase family DNA binding protein